jgi:DNA-binding NarL/FixJ family response regulator
MKTRVLLVDAQKLLLEGLKLLLQGRVDMDVAGEAEDGRLAIELARESRPDVILMDVDLPLMNGIEATRRIVAENAGARVIALTNRADRGAVNDMLKAGAAGYMLKNDSFAELCRAVKIVAAGQTYLCPTVAGILVNQYHRASASRTEASSSLLSPREREVLQLIAEGMTLKEIAARLTLSIKTIETHRKKIMNKLQLHSVAELTKYAIQQGMTSATIHRPA